MATSGPPSDVNSPGTPVDPSPAPASAPGPGTRTGTPQPSTADKSKRNKRDSRKKRESKGLDPDHAPPPKKKPPTAATNTALPSSDLSILRPLLLAEPRPSDLLPPPPRHLNLIKQTACPTLGKTWDFYEVVDKLTNKNGFRYSYAIADPEFAHLRYRQTDLAPYHARFSFEDSPAAILFSKDARAVTTTDPWHTARANVCAREGQYYYEARIISGVQSQSQPQTQTQTQGVPGEKRGNVRLGFARREADLDVNVGVDCYGYGIRDVNGEVVNRMRCEYFFPKGEAIREGDVIGMMITLPPLSLHKKIVEGTYVPGSESTLQAENDNSNNGHNIIRDRIPFHYKSDFCWQQSNVFATKHLRDYAFNLKDTPGLGPPSPLNQDDPSMRTLPGSSISIYKNGVYMGTPFKDLYAFLPPASRLSNATNNLGLGERENADDGMIGYYPAVSCYGGGAVECRFEEPWWFPPDCQTKPAPIGDRFSDQIVEDVVADIVDEVEAMMVWGDALSAPVPAAPAASGAAAPVGGAGAAQNNSGGAAGASAQEDGVNGTSQDNGAMQVDSGAQDSAMQVDTAEPTTTTITEDVEMS